MAWVAGLREAGPGGLGGWWGNPAVSLLPPVQGKDSKEVKEETAEERLRRRAYERGCQRLKKRIEGQACLGRAAGQLGGWAACTCVLGARPCPGWAQGPWWWSPIPACTPPAPGPQGGVLRAQCPLPARPSGGRTAGPDPEAAAEQ